MAVEAYAVHYDKVNYHAPILGGNREEVFQAREHEIADNMVRYLGEYRLGVKFDEYYYNVGQNDTGERFFTSKEPGPIRDIYRRAISVREKEGLSVKREVAECLGFEKLEKDLLEAPIGTMAVWVSPPGESKDGYGGYSFTFLSQVEENEGERRVRMIPYRNEKTLNEHNDYLTQITGDEVSFTKDTEYLSTPFIVSPSERIKSPEDMLRVIGETEDINNEWSTELIEEEWPILQGYLYLVKNNASDEALIKARNALENYAIAFKAGKRNTFEVPLNESFRTTAMWAIEKWGAVAPPVAKGSCGIGGGNESSLLTPMDYQNKLGKNSNEFSSTRDRVLCCTCPFCKREVEAKISGGRIKCPECLKSAEWSD